MEKRPMKRKGGNGGLTRKRINDDQRAIAIKDTAGQSCGLAKALAPHQDAISAICPQSAIDASMEGVRSNQTYNRESVMPILRMIAIGMTQEDAAALVHITPSTLSKWKSKHADFELACERAKSINKNLLLNVIYQGMEKSPRLALDLLERVHPKEYAQTKRVDGQMNHTHAHGPSALLQTLHAERLKVDQARTSDDQSVVLDAQVIDGEQKQLNPGGKTAEGGSGEGSVPSGGQDI